MEQPTYTNPSEIPQDIAKKLLAIRDALIANDNAEAWHQLYSIASPDFCDYEPWNALENTATRIISPPPAKTLESNPCGIEGIIDLGITYWDGK